MTEASYNAESSTDASEEHVILKWSKTTKTTTTRSSLKND